MWSLPTLKQLNAQAESKGYEEKLKRACRTGISDGERLICEWQDHDEPSRCEGELRHYLHYDIFSDKPKGILTLCEHHDGYYGDPSEGWFTCIDCQRVLIENITWEMYRHDTDDGPICIPCYLQRVMDDDRRWIPLTDEAINSVTEDSLRKAPHCIAVQMPIPKDTIRMVNNVEYDSYSGRGISGGGAEELREALRELQAEGATRALLILDAAYQFAISIGVYAPTKGGKYDVQPETAVRR